MAIVMKDIADRLGVSRTAVSYALSGTGRLDPETRERIKQVAAEMGYRPNLAASSMQTGKTRTIGVIVAMRDPFFARVLQGIHDALAVRNYMPLLLAPSRREALLDQIHRLIDRRVDGVILRPPNDLDADVWREEVEKWHIPLVTVDAPLPTAPHVDFVGTNDEKGGALVARHLLDLGHRRFGMVAGSWFYTGQARARGFEQELGKVVGTSCTTVTVPGPKSAPPKIHELLDMRPPPTAVFAMTDRLAFPFYDIARERGMEIGLDLSLVGYCDSVASVLLSPQLTSIHQAPEAMGEQAAQFVLDRIEPSGDDDTPPRRLEMDPALVVRGSSGPLMKDSSQK
ncbi:MAG: LacI family DNA-binding transcriptional regulator [Verrucomicrobia bacterium]|jgi:LacI family transcriptional regulator|nr:LacI family DNA-binding transcriptional regulator [Verrucomicrobiota bacterium]